jgi:hypothetical protein
VPQRVSESTSSKWSTVLFFLDARRASFEGLEPDNPIMERQISKTVVELPLRGPVLFNVAIAVTAAGFGVGLAVLFGSRPSR